MRRAALLLLRVVVIMENVRAENEVNAESYRPFCTFLRTCRAICSLPGRPGNVAKHGHNRTTDECA